ncbi:MAG TPA: hypothetical protein VFQ38_17095 [Longimicrobiales bacterium]|nr:hypothetical protein [Longimicrobiales bacterium]
MVTRTTLILVLALVGPPISRCGAQALGSAPPTTAPRLVMPAPGARVAGPVPVLVWRLPEGTSAVRVWADSAEVSAHAVEAPGKLIVVLPEDGQLAPGRHRLIAEACSPVRCDLSETELEVGAGGSAGRAGTRRLDLVLRVLEGVALWFLAR